MSHSEVISHFRCWIVTCHSRHYGIKGVFQATHEFVRFQRHLDFSDVTDEGDIKSLAFIGVVRRFSPVCGMEGCGITPYAITATTKLFYIRHCA